MIIPSVATSQPSNTEEKIKIESQIGLLLNQGLEQYQHEINELASQLSIDERKVLYSAFEKHLYFPIIMNLLLPLGMGSALEGDVEGFIWEASLEGIGLLLISLSISLSLSESVYLTAIHQQHPAINYAQIFTLDNGIIAGVLLALPFILLGKVYGVLRPLYYVDHYNQELRVSLQLTRRSFFSFEPNIKQAGDFTTPGFQVLHRF